MVSLGTRKSTKAKRVQSVVVRNPLIIGLLRWLVHSCTAESSLMGCSYDTYRKLLRSAQEQSRLEAGYSPHSPRAGFATESIAEGADFVSVREAGRWLSDTSLRVYLDVVGAASLAASQKAAGREHELVFAATNLLSYLPGATKFQRQEDHHGADVRDAFGHAQGSRWTTVPRMGPEPRASSSGLPSAEAQQGLDSNSESPTEPCVTFANHGEPGCLSSHGERFPRGRGRGQASSSRGQGRGRRSETKSSR